MRKTGAFLLVLRVLWAFCDFAGRPLDPRPINFADFNGRGGGGLLAVGSQRSDPGPVSWLWLLLVVKSDILILLQIKEAVCHGIYG